MPLSGLLYARCLRGKHDNGYKFYEERQIRIVMAKIPFTLEAWLKDKSQRVETRDGRTVEILSTNCKVRESQPILAQIRGSKNSYTLEYYYKGGKAEDQNYNLFIVTPDPELTEFEEELATVIGFAISQSVVEPNENTFKFVKNWSERLLDLARKEIEEELKEKVLHDYWKQASDQCIQARKEGKLEALKEIEQDPESSYAFKRGFEYGKKEALKDFPRWKKAEKDMHVVSRCIVERVDLSNFIPKNSYYIPIVDLLKLPGFKEE